MRLYSAVLAPVATALSSTLLFSALSSGVLLTSFIAETSVAQTSEQVVKPAPGRGSRWLEEQKKTCDRYYAGLIQAGIRRACTVGGVLVDRYLDQPNRVAEAGCRLQYGEEPGETFACMIGTKIARELQNKTSQYLTDFQLCSESYPVRTELDTFLLESCLTGIHARSFMVPLQRFELCQSITQERSFQGPCSVGAALYQDPQAASATSKATAIAHRTQCEKYFDHLRFHMGYRSCLNAQAVSPGNESEPLTLDEIRRRCDRIVSDNGNDHERGACVIGAVLLETRKKGGSTAIFDACGVNQVRYEDRDVLGCLAAGSFLSYSNVPTADRLCREIFRDRRSLARTGCINSIATLNKGGTKPSSKTE
ncbi:MAG: hypothetical protein RBT63_05830 [Bdellovibrionales bacterium]|jgi:hypothetical protein|nr:hypothetical protein [Bdellovibrionales bacterium]